MIFNRVQVRSAMFVAIMATVEVAVTACPRTAPCVCVLILYTSGLSSTNVHGSSPHKLKGTDIFAKL